MPRRIRLSIALCALFLSAGLAVAGASAKAPLAHSSAVCKSVTLTSLNGGYFFPATVKGASCATSRKIETAWQACRLKHGTSGRCTSKVVGFSCHETRPQSIPTTFTAVVSCKRSHATVKYSYSQNT